MLELGCNAASVGKEKEAVMATMKKELVHKGSGYRLYWYSDEEYVESTAERELSSGEFRDNMERLMAPLPGKESPQVSGRYEQTGSDCS